MVAGLAHEINNPLMELGSYVGYARERSDGRIYEMRGKAETQIERISGILTNLLQYTRPASGEGGEHTQMVAAVRHAVDFVAAQLRTRTILSLLELLRAETQAVSLEGIRRIELLRALVDLLALLGGTAMLWALWRRLVVG